MSKFSVACPASSNRRRAGRRRALRSAGIISRAGGSDDGTANGPTFDDISVKVKSCDGRRRESVGIA
eukprot:CAMPEP_0172538882 /NCGR_PEP_ID=MMETSP1067-20121228/10187_2 /TAXON_ID=265564 ORGANISM="Thalassiosira punctigera, Strain Tpunct2005C2" /NCGR_SAMPLE_ID=MMETSP1067 /ASSEMBLY_ACC=CAM_ASM_000444 /LENGTH=66 /DNA_ID=CAMNT_0013324473 /DNA_START=1535 /DNA_END=1735 /DNA_ORIENTATION=-